MNKDPHELLETHFGWSEFKPGQQDVVQRLLNGHSVLSVFPTGGGKSLCYQLPALAFDGLTVVVSPLIALMKDQIDQLQAKGVFAVRLDSSITGDEYRAAMDFIRSGAAKLLYVAPERFFNERFRASLDGIPIALFAIDEAHCISQWGHNFRPDYLKLAALARSLKFQRVLALTATATPDVQDDICKAFDIRDDNVICTEFFRPNLHIRSQVVNERTRIEVLTDQLASKPPGATIVYVSLQKTAEQTAQVLANAGLPAQAYHAGMETEVRNEIQEWFMTGENKIVVATIAFGMGIDKSDIRYVYHFNPPKSIESYAQEIGRAGRDGKTSLCEMLLVPADRITIDNFVYGDTPSRESIKTFIDEIGRRADEFFISQYTLGNVCDIKPIVVKTLLTYLELDGFLESTSPRYDAYSFQPKVPSSTIFENLSGEPQQFAKGLLATSKKRRVWFSIDIVEAMKKLGCERNRIVKALDYFAEKGWIELRVSGLVHGYRKLKSFGGQHGLVDDYVQRVERREAAEIARTEQVFELAQAKQCQAGVISAYFGQPLASDCGACSFCQGAGPYEIQAAPLEEVAAADLETCRRLVEEHPAALQSARSLARFLCGLTSPALTRSKLSRHESFGSLRNVSFRQVMDQMTEVVAQANFESPF